MVSLETPNKGPFRKTIPVLTFYLGLCGLTRYIYLSGLRGSTNDEIF